MQPLNRNTAHAATLPPVKVLQFGEGNFLRAFVDWIIDILNEKAGFNGAVQIIQPIAQGLSDKINEQQGLYHVILQGIQHGQAIRETRLVRCVQGVLNPYEVPYHEFLKTAENPDLEFVISNTTEAGIAFDERDTSPDQLSTSFPGKLTALLFHRYKHFQGDPAKALIIIPCELIDKNGDTLRDVILHYADTWKLPEDFKQYVRVHTTFCNTLVDRIVPGFPRDTIQGIQQELSYEDNLVVTAEPFHLWVIEAPDTVAARFPAKKTQLQVKFVSDQAPYRTRKVRILNGAHTVLVPVAYLLGLRTVRESVEAAFTQHFLDGVLYEEIIPTLDLPAEELQQFAQDVMERFRNPFIRHELMSIALNSVSKFKTRVLPSLIEYHHRYHKLPKRLVFSLAALIRFYQGTWQQSAIPLNDTPEVLTFFQTAWQHHDLRAIAEQVLAQTAFWGTNLNEISGLTDAVTSALRVIDTPSRWTEVL